MSIKAKYASICPGCNARIQVGTSVEWSKGNPARHVACVNAVPNHAAPARRSEYAPTRGYRGARGCHTNGDCSSLCEPSSCPCGDGTWYRCC